jgi:hypothetical protein
MAARSRVPGLCERWSEGRNTQPERVVSSEAVPRAPKGLRRQATPWSNTLALQVGPWALIGRRSLRVKDTGESCRPKPSPVRFPIYPRRRYPIGRPASRSQPAGDAGAHVSTPKIGVPRTNRRRFFIYLRCLPCVWHAASDTPRLVRVAGVVCNNKSVITTTGAYSAVCVVRCSSPAAACASSSAACRSAAGEYPAEPHSSCIGAHAGWRRAETSRSPYSRRGSSRPLLGLTADPGGIDDKHGWPFCCRSKQSAETVEPDLPSTAIDGQPPPYAASQTNITTAVVACQDSQSHVDDATRKTRLAVLDGGARVPSAVS